VPLILHDDVEALQYDAEDGYETDDATVHSTDDDSAGISRGMQSDMVEPAERAPIFVDIHPTAGAVVGIGAPVFAQCRSLLMDQELGLPHPFGSKEEMGLGSWLHESGLSHAKINEFLRLPYVCRF
jgi:hypothetical protein